ncbi:MAG TPA: carbohydrate ABC transporter permease [Sphaerochaetaceae bacterium]|nr:carbohydrate ABC transporter permease [Sphaerochaetaceae bacterium]
MMNKKRKALNSLLLNVFILALGIGMLYPILWLIGASFKPSNMIFTTAGIFPETATLSNYVQGWKGIGIVGFGTFFINSFTICFVSAFANVLFCSLTAYAFARLEFSGKRIWFVLMMMTLMLPAHVTTIPRYVMFRTFGWINTSLPIIVPKFFATDAFFIFLLIQFIRGLPKDLDDSAYIDGCNKFTIYSRIIMPLTLPALITTVLFTFLWTWDDFFNQLLYLTSPDKYTVPMGLRLFLDASGISSWGPMFAMSVLSLMPAFILFFSLQKYFVKGIATTGIKG